MDKYLQLLNLIKSKIEAHQEFKNAYNKQLAFDFNILNFFNPGENKTTEILAFFLNPKQSHGQGDVFLVEFLKLICGEENSNTSNLEEVACEKVIENSRRIDLYIKFKDRVIAIENKIWAIDQNKQLNDYANHLKKKSDNFLLLYLNPYGHQPSESSIDKVSLLELKESFKIISYSKEILSLLDKWIIVCEADNVTYFLKQLKQYFKTEYLGVNTLNMTDSLEKVIRENIEEVSALAKAYYESQTKVINRIDSIGEKLTKEIQAKGIKAKKASTFTDYRGAHGVKFGVSKGNIEIWVQLYEEKLEIISSHYTKNINEVHELNKNKRLVTKDNTTETDEEIIKYILSEIENAVAYFKNQQ